MNNGRLCVGRIGKPHGLRGEVVVALSTNRLERLAPAAVLYAADRPLVVEAARPLGRRFVVRFAGVDDLAGADALRGAELSAEPIDDADELWVHELIGATVIDQDGIERGRVDSVAANPASDLLVLDSGALVPVRFVVDHTPNQRVVVEVPLGLFDELFG